MTYEKTWEALEAAAPTFGGSRGITSQEFIPLQAGLQVLAPAHNPRCCGLYVSIPAAVQC